MRNRWLVLCAGTFLMAILGALYSWSVVGDALAAGLKWSHTQATQAFAWAVFFVGVGALVGGRWQDRAGPRVVALTGVVLWGMANVLAGVGTSSLGALWLYSTYGVIGGFGVGLGYTSTVAIAIKWFPDRPGLAGGIVAMGFGVGSIVYNLALGIVLPVLASLAGHRAGNPPQEQARAALAALMYSGAVFVVLGLVCACFLKKAPAPVASASRSVLRSTSFTTAEMLRTPQFFLLWSMFFANICGGMLVIANAVPIIEELTHVGAPLAAKAYAAAALANAFGRCFWGAVSDRIGHNRTYAALFGIQAATFIAMSSIHNVQWLAVGVAIILLCFGGGFGVMPSFNTRYFGTAHMGSNYGVLLTAWGCAGLAAPLLAARIADTAGSFAHALTSTGLLLVTALMLPALSRAPRRRDIATFDLDRYV
ncbi:OFA family MFS transporter [Trinickia sp. LjRoot230]